MAVMGFPPLFDGNSKILILGSFPSVRSREVQFYYGNKQNRFWRVLQQLFGGSVDTVEQKKQLCLHNGIALWDIVISCEINGSLDSDIKKPVPADLSAVLSHAPIEKILCNGAKAYELTLRAYKGQIPVIKMPSTSPANVHFDFQKWADELLLDGSKLNGRNDNA